MNRDELPSNLLEALCGASTVTVLTGAGISAESGIPTFRDAHKGLWAKHDPMMLASPRGFEQNPELVWDWYQWRRGLVRDARPNAGHRALAALETRFDSFRIITQNVDGLHHRAGSTDVLELHGNIQRNICSVTRRTIDAEWIARHTDQRPPPSPHHGQGLARPDVVWFGESLDEATLEQAFENAANCDFMLVVGTAGAVQPAASLPVLSHRNGIPIAEINPHRSELTALADWHLQGPGGFWLPLLDQAVQRR